LLQTVISKIITELHKTLPHAIGVAKFSETANFKGKRLCAKKFTRILISAKNREALEILNS